jgi:hypothetical protein
MGRSKGAAAPLPDEAPKIVARGADKENKATAERRARRPAFAFARLC